MHLERVGCGVGILNVRARGDSELEEQASVALLQVKKKNGI